MRKLSGSGWIVPCSLPSFPDRYVLLRVTYCPRPCSVTYCSSSSKRQEWPIPPPGYTASPVHPDFAILQGAASSRPFLDSASCIRLNLFSSSIPSFRLLSFSSRLPDPLPCGRRDRRGCVTAASDLFNSSTSFQSLLSVSTYDYYPTALRRLIWVTLID